jgi:type IX secretion system PorP/SprF family membrane protein
VLKKKQFYTIVWLMLTAFCAGSPLSAQDPQFSQFYASPLYLNPAFAGAAGEGRLGINYRNQWPNLPASFVTYTAWGDFFIPKANSGIGILVMTDRAGEAGVRATSATMQYAYQLQISDKMGFRMAAQGSYIRRNVDYSSLIFASQIDPVNGYDPNIPGPNLGGLNSHLFSLGLGSVLYAEKGWLGLSVNHINRPNESLTEDFSPLPRKTSIHAGYKFQLSPGGRKYDLAYTFQERAFVPVLQYRSQFEYQSLDAGAYFYLEPMVVGFWYRGLPVAGLNRLPYNEALLLLLGLSYENMSFGYSFDYTISRLGIASGGAHEISITFLLQGKQNIKKRNNPLPVPLPKF